MTEPMTSRERFQRMFDHREADRVPIIDGPWGATIERWHSEGMPKGTSYVDFFGLDKTAGIGVDNSPRFPRQVIEETDTYSVYTTTWGATQRTWKHAASTPEFLAHTVVDADSWRKAKERMLPTLDRVNWDHLREHYPIWERQGYWIEAGFWFGFDVTHSWFVGTERVLMALATDPEWVVDIFNTMLDLDLALFQKVWDEGYRFHAIRWPDDMGYKGHQFFSPRMYRELVKPVHRRAIEWAHAKGIPAILHSCGDVNPFLPEFLDMGLDGLNPLEVKAGMDPIAIKKQYGDRLLLHGGINAVLWDDFDAIAAEMRRVVPVLKQGGGYIFSSDHSVPSSVSLDNFRRIVELAKELGAYE